MMVSILLFLHRCNRFSAKPTKGTITMVLFAPLNKAGISNIRLLPAPVGRMINNGLFPSIVAVRTHTHVSDCHASLFKTFISKFQLMFLPHLFLIYKPPWSLWLFRLDRQ